jgi:hypothetical protein
VTWQHALDYVALLNADNYLGYSDWRLPTIEEISTLVDAGRYDTAIDPVFNPVESPYWSSTTAVSGVGYAWGMDFVNGYLRRVLKTTSRYVRAVRGGPYVALGNFIINGDGTVTDTITGFMWQQCQYGQTWDGAQCTGAAATRTWDEAFAYVQGLNGTGYLGYDDWRLPNRNELQGLVDYNLFSPASTFPNTLVAAFYWSSTTYANYTSQAWLVDFINGYVSNASKTTPRYVRAVRGGPCRSLGDWCINENDCAEGMLCEEQQCIEPCAESWQCDEGTGCVEGLCVEDNPPTINDGPFLAAGTWPMLATSESRTSSLDQNYAVLWTFDDDYSTCEGEGLCAHRARYRRADDTKWLYLNVTTDPSGKWYAITELPVDRMVDGTYYFQFDLFDCAGQLTSSRTYYFKVAH